MINSICDTIAQIFFHLSVKIENNRNNGVYEYAKSYFEKN